MAAGKPWVCQREHIQEQIAHTEESRLSGSCTAGELDFTAALSLEAAVRSLLRCLLDGRLQMGVGMPRIADSCTGSLMHSSRVATRDCRGGGVHLEDGSAQIPVCTGKRIDNAIICRYLRHRAPREGPPERGASKAQDRHCCRSAQKRTTGTQSPCQVSAAEAHP